MDKETFQEMTKQEKIDCLFAKIDNIKSVAAWHNREYSNGKNWMKNCKDACTVIYDNCKSILSAYEEETLIDLNLKNKRDKVEMQFDKFMNDENISKQKKDQVLKIIMDMLNLFEKEN